MALSDNRDLIRTSCKWPAPNEHIGIKGSNFAPVELTFFSGAIVHDIGFAETIIIIL